LYFGVVIVMVSRRRRGCARVALLAILASAVGAQPKDEQAVIKSSCQTMCDAVVSEMVIEIYKHDLKARGEEEIYETVPAICLAIVQNFTYVEKSADSWVLEHKVFARARTA
jgi:hypothetical protein